MKLLITGVCGFVGAALAEELLSRIEGLSVWGIDNLMRPGSETNRSRLKRLGLAFVHGDIRCASDLQALRWSDNPVLKAVLVERQPFPLGIVA